MLARLYLPAATKLGQGNVLQVCLILFTGRGVCLSACWGTTPQEQTPPGAITPHGADTPQSRHPPEWTPPQEQTPLEETPLSSRHPLGADTPQEQTHPLGADTPQEQTHPTGSRHPPEQTPPGKQTTAYGQRSAGTHPTGMHSCFHVLFSS